MGWQSVDRRLDRVCRRDWVDRRERRQCYWRYREAVIAAHVIYGQGGRLTSLGMDKLADRIRLLRAPVEMWRWKDYAAVIAAVAAQSTRGKTPILIGYSLGANSITWIAQQ